MKKLSIMGLIFGMLSITGCSTTTITPIDTNGKNDTYYMQDSSMYDFYVDKATCVEYILRVGNGGAMTPRLNSDGTLLLNEICLKEKNK